MRGAFDRIDLVPHHQFELVCWSFSCTLQQTRLIAGALKDFDIHELGTCGANVEGDANRALGILIDLLAVLARTTIRLSNYGFSCATHSSQVHLFLGAGRCIVTPFLQLILNDFLPYPIPMIIEMQLILVKEFRICPTGIITKHEDTIAKRGI